jgi:Domain amino terminal to FKBP-type peptidyl-prolyl isomerase
MKLKYLTPFAAIALVAPALAGQPTILKDQRDKASYSIGVNIGSGMKANSLDLNTEALMAGLQDGISATRIAKRLSRPSSRIFRRKRRNGLSSSPTRIRRKAQNFLRPTRPKKA